MTKPSKSTPSKTAAKPKRSLVLRDPVHGMYPALRAIVDRICNSNDGLIDCYLLLAAAEQLLFKAEHDPAIEQRIVARGALLQAKVFQGHMNSMSALLSEKGN